MSRFGLKNGLRLMAVIVAVVAFLEQSRGEDEGGTDVKWATSYQERMKVPMSTSCELRRRAREQLGFRPMISVDVRRERNYIWEAKLVAREQCRKLTGEMKDAVRMERKRE